MQQKDFMFDLYRKGQQIFDECSGADYVNEFKEFKPNLILYEKKSSSDLSLLGSFQFFDELRDARSMHRNHPITTIPPKGCDSFVYYSKDNELKYVSIMQERGIPYGDVVKFDGHVQILFDYTTPNRENRIVQIMTVEEKNGEIHAMKIDGFYTNGQNVQYKIEYKNDTKYVYTLWSYIMYRKKHTYSKEERCSLFEESSYGYIKSFRNLLKDDYALWFERLFWKNHTSVPLMAGQKSLRTGNDVSFFRYRKAYI